MKNHRQQIIGSTNLLSTCLNFIFYSTKSNTNFKLVLTFFASILSFNILIGQICEPPTAETDLDVNNVSAGLTSGGSLWQGQSGGSYIVPKQAAGLPQVSAIFSGGLWIGGFDQGSNIKLATQTGSGFAPGPLSNSGTVEMEDCINYDRLWETTSGAINSHIADWNDNGVIDGPVPNSILAWPGKDNPEFFGIHGFNLPPLHSMAPFVDQNNNAIYEPMQGDYPDINEADQGVWWVCNDVGGSSGSSPLGFEIQTLAYAYISSNPNINNATFYDYKFINQSTEPLDSAYIALWADFDLGCFLDDYVGCNPSENLAYVYNSDALDGISNCNDCQGVNTYCEAIPIVGIKMLEGIKVLENGQTVDRKMSSFQYYNNGGVTPPPQPGTDDPGSALQYYNLMSGSWIDGTRLTEGGNGYDPTSTAFTNYAFPDPPNDADGWSACTANLPASDPRVVIGSGPFRVEPGSTNSMCFAVIYASDVEYPCPSIDPLIEASNDVQDLYENIVSTTEVLAQTPANIQFQPNPMTDQAELIFKDLENQVKQVGIFALDGRQVQTYDDINGNTLVIQRKDLSPGIYFYKLLTEDFKIHSGKFIVQ